MTELEELRSIVKMEPAMKSFMRIFEEAKEIALRGGTKLDMKTTKKAYFLDNLAGVPAGDPILEGGTKEEMAEKMYQSQLSLIKIFRDKGLPLLKPSQVPLFFLILQARASRNSQWKNWNESIPRKMWKFLGRNKNSYL